MNKMQKYKNNEEKKIWLDVVYHQLFKNETNESYLKK